MTVIGMVRHGITEWNLLGIAQGSADVSLNETGKRQAEALAKRLVSEETWDLIVSSDLARAKETAEIISEMLNVPIRFFDPRLREMFGGEIEGTTEQQRLEKWGENWRQLEFGMERADSVGKRGVEALESIAKEFQGKRVLVVSHGGLIGITLRKLMPGRFEKTDMQNTSITILKQSGSDWDCILYNCAKHLEREEI